MKKLILFIFLILILLSCSHSNIPKTDSHRYIITSPEVAELIYLLGAQKNVVGVTIECDYPSYYKHIEKIGNFGKVNIEKIISLKPDVVFTTKLEQDKLNYTLKKLNIKTVALYPKTINEELNEILQLGKILHKENRAKVVYDSLKSELEKIKSKIQKKRPKVYVEIYDNPLMTASQESFVGQLISYANGENIFDKLPRDYSQINQEEIIKRNPDVIISLVPNVTAKRIKERKGWQNISAVKSGMVYTTEDINPDIVLRAGSRIVTAIKKLDTLIHNEKAD